MAKKVLVLGGGVAGASLTYYLTRKGYKVTLVEEKGKEVGGLSRTYNYGGHPYEFGPHVWFWQDPSSVNDLVREFTNDELWRVDRRLFSVIESDRRIYRYPIHFEDIQTMDDKDQIMEELKKNRDENLKIKPEMMPIIGQCTFEEYFTAALGKTLYTKFMREYCHKMWGIPGNELQTSMVWADILKHHYKNLVGYDPLKFGDYTLGADINFQVYPKKGWNVVWDKMIVGAEIIKAKVHQLWYPNRIILAVADGSNLVLDMCNYDRVISTLAIDALLGDETELPYTGRMMLLCLLPLHAQEVFPANAESLHFSGTEFQTRITDVDVITHCKRPDRLLLVEIPITQDMDEKSFPKNVMVNAQRKNLFVKRAYAQQSKKGLAMYQEYLERSNSRYPSLLHCGRQAEFRYTSMPETVEAARVLVEENF